MIQNTGILRPLNWLIIPVEFFNRLSSYTTPITITLGQPHDFIRPPNSTTFDEPTTRSITVMMQQQHSRLAQMDRPNRHAPPPPATTTAPSKPSATIWHRSNAALPTKSVLAQWRDDMLAGRADDAGKVYRRSQRECAAVSGPEAAARCCR